MNMYEVCAQSFVGSDMELVEIRSCKYDVFVTPKSTIVAQTCSYYLKLVKSYLSASWARASLLSLLFSTTSASPAPSS